MEEREEKFRLGLKRSFFNQNLKLALREAGITSEIVQQKIKIPPTTLSMIINFRHCPTEEQKINLAVLLNIPIEDIFPEKYDELYEKVSPLRREASVKIDFLRLTDPEVLALESHEDLIKKTDDKLTVGKMLEILTTKERRILEMRNGLTDGKVYTIEEVGMEFGVTRERIRQVEAKANEKIRQGFGHVIGELRV